MFYTSGDVGDCGYPFSRAQVTEYEISFTDRHNRKSSSLYTGLVFLTSVTTFFIQTSHIMCKILLDSVI